MRGFFFLWPYIAFFLWSSSVNSQDSSCFRQVLDEILNDYLHEAQLLSPGEEWISLVRWKTQNPSTLSQWYIERHTQGLQMLHSKISAKAIQGPTDLAQLLKDQHRQMVQGDDGTVVYWGTKGVITNWNPLKGEPWPRSASWWKDPPPPRIGEFRNSGATVTLFHHEGGAIPNSYGIGPSDLTPALLARFQERPLARVVIPGVPHTPILRFNFKKKPQGDLIPISATFSTTEGTTVEQFLPSAYQQFKILQDASAQSAQFRAALPRYFQILTMARFFEQVNNSLYMIHINYFLMKAGLKPIAHTNLDVLAMLYADTMAIGENSLRPGEFEDIFWKKVQELQ